MIQEICAHRCGMVFATWNLDSGNRATGSKFRPQSHGFEDGVVGKIPLGSPGGIRIPSCERASAQLGIHRFGDMVITKYDLGIRKFKACGSREANGVIIKRDATDIANRKVGHLKKRALFGSFKNFPHSRVQAHRAAKRKVGIDCISLNVFIGLVGPIPKTTILVYVNRVGLGHWTYGRVFRSDGTRKRIAYPLGDDVTVYCAKMPKPPIRSR